MSTVNLTITYPNGNISHLSITKNENGTYSFSSTGNLIQCPDCNDLFSLHAKACPFCGCPLDYVIPHWFEKFYTAPSEKEVSSNSKPNKSEHQIEQKYFSDWDYQRKKEEIIKKAQSYKKLIGNNPFPKYSINDSIEELQAVLDEAEAMVVRIGELKTEITSVMREKDISDPQLGSYGKYLSSTSIRDLEKLLNYINAL